MDSLRSDISTIPVMNQVTCSQGVYLLSMKMAASMQVICVTAGEVQNTMASCKKCTFVDLG